MKKSIILLVAFCLLSSLLSADEVFRLKDGKVYSGTICNTNEETIAIITEVGNIIEIPRNQILVTKETKSLKESSQVFNKPESAETDPLKAINNTLLFNVERRDPAFACFLSMTTLGGGQIYNYQPHKAIVTYIISVASVAAVYFGGQPGIAIGGLILFGTWFYGPKELEYKYKIGVKFRY